MARYVYDAEYWEAHGCLRPVGPGENRERDNRRLKLPSQGCHPSQAVEFNKRFGRVGAEWDRGGNCVAEDYPSQQRLYRERGYEMRE